MAASSMGYSLMVIIRKGRVNQDVYIKKILPKAKKYGDKVFGDNLSYQQNGATCHTAQAVGTIGPRPLAKGPLAC